jgi:CheY-like chemotaxis protein
MDIQMPRMNGYEAAGRLRQQGFSKPIIAVTASALSDERERCMRVGFSDILIKPFRRPDIEKMLQTWPPAPPDGDAPAPAGSAAPSPVEGAADFVSPSPVPTGSVAESAAAAPVSPPPDQIFNITEALDTFMDNTEMIRSLLTKYIERTREQLTVELPRSMEAGDWEAARRGAHTIKGSALTLAAKELGRTAARLELAFKRIDQAEITVALPPLEAAFSRFEAAVRCYLGSQAGETSSEACQAEQGA